METFWFVYQIAFALVAFGTLLQWASIEAFRKYSFMQIVLCILIMGVIPIVNIYFALGVTVTTLKRTYF